MDYKDLDLNTEYYIDGNDIIWGDISDMNLYYAEQEEGLLDDDYADFEHDDFETLTGKQLLLELEKERLLDIITELQYDKARQQHYIESLEKGLERVMEV